MLKKLAKLCAKFALGYLPDVALYLVKMATEKTAESEKAQHALAVIKQIASDATLIANTMEDGTVSEIEANQLQMRVEVLAEEIGELL